MRLLEQNILATTLRLQLQSSIKKSNYCSLKFMYFVIVSKQTWKLWMWYRAVSNNFDNDNFEHVLMCHQNMTSGEHRRGLQLVTIL